MVSIIIPVLNEEKGIEALLEHAAALPGDKEIIVVDGGSADRTAELAAHRAVVIEAPRGRGPQCNAGASTAHGDIFFFLHADSRLEVDALEKIERAVVQGASWGCLKLRFGDGHWFGRIVALCSNLRARWRGLVFGDQGIFMTRGLFGQLGGFRELPLMEDYQLSLDLKKRGIAPRQIGSRIVTSARRFTSGGWLRTLWRMRRLRALYRQGVDIGEIMGCYQDARWKQTRPWAPPTPARGRAPLTHLKRRAVILFTRLPIPGQTKTRMMPALSPDACAELQWALLGDLAPVLQRAEEDIFVFYTPDGYPAELERLRSLMPSAVFLAQRGEGLGLRMDQAFTLTFERGYDGCLLLGSDIPLVDAGEIEAAWHELRDNDVVLAPCEDGGYWLVGLKATFPALFTGQSYGTDAVMEQARKICAAEGRSLGYGAQKRDMDDIEDLRFFQRTLTPGQTPCLYAYLAPLRGGPL